METEPQGFETNLVESPSNNGKRPEIVGVPQELVRGTNKALTSASSRPEPVTQPLKPVEAEKLNAEALEASLAKRDKEILTIINKLDPNNREQHMSTPDRKTNFIFWAGTISKLPTDLARREFFVGDTGEGRFGYPKKATDQDKAQRDQRIDQMVNLLLEQWQDHEKLMKINDMDSNEEHEAAFNRAINYYLLRLNKEVVRDVAKTNLMQLQKSKAYFDMPFEKQDLTKLIEAIGNINPKTPIEKPGLIQRSLEKIGFKKQSTTQEEINTKNLEQLYLLLQKYFTEFPSKNTKNE